MGGVYRILEYLRKQKILPDQEENYSLIVTLSDAAYKFENVVSSIHDRRTIYWLKRKLPELK